MHRLPRYAAREARRAWPPARRFAWRAYARDPRGFAVRTWFEPRLGCGARWFVRTPYVHGSNRASGGGALVRSNAVRTRYEPRLGCGARWFVRTPYVRGSNRASGGGALVRSNAVRTRFGPRLGWGRSGSFERRK